MILPFPPSFIPIKKPKSENRYFWSGPIAVNLWLPGHCFYEIYFDIVIYFYYGNLHNPQMYTSHD